MTQPKPKRIDRRKNRTCVRYTEKDSAKMQKRMAQTGKSAQELMKKALFSLPEEALAPQLSSEQVDVLLSQLKQIGVVNNELARKANAGELIPNSPHFATIAAAYVAIRLKMEGKLPLELPLTLPSVVDNA